MPRSLAFRIFSRLLLLLFILSGGSIACEKQTSKSLTLINDLHQLRSTLSIQKYKLQQEEKRVNQIDLVTKKLEHATEKEKEILMTLSISIQKREQTLNHLEKSLKRILRQWKRIHQQMKKLQWQYQNIKRAYLAASKNWKKTSQQYEKIAQIYQQVQGQLQMITILLKNYKGIRQLAEVIKTPGGLKQLLQTTIKEFPKQMKLAVDRAIQEKKRLLLKVLSCRSISLNNFKQQLIKKGFPFTKKKLVQIIPEAQGGAEHPFNYQLDFSSKVAPSTNLLNRCMSYGSKQCANALLASTMCGNLRGSQYLTSLMHSFTLETTIKQIFKGATKATWNKIWKKRKLRRL